MLVLYTTAISANGRKALAVAKHLELNIDVRSVDVCRGEGRTADYLKLNPSGKVPTLVDEEFILWESNAILVHLAEAHGNFVLSSRDNMTRADILRWLFWESSHWQPVVTRVLAARVAQILGLVSNAESRDVFWRDAELVSTLCVLGSILERRQFICGDNVTIADFSVAGMTTYFSATGFPSQEYPAIARWIQRMNEISAWTATLVDPWAQSAG